LRLSVRGALAVGSASLLAACGGRQQRPPRSGGPTPARLPDVAQFGQGAKTVIFWRGLGGADGTRPLLVGP